MSQLRGIKEKIAAIMATVAGMDPVTIHPRARNWAGTDDAYFNALFTSALTGKPRINGWMIEHEGGTSRWTEYAQRWMRTDVISIKGFFGLSDATDSEKIFSSLVQGVCEAINANPQLDGLVVDHDPVQVRRYGQVGGHQVGGNLCHHADLAVHVTWVDRVAALGAPATSAQGQALVVNAPTGLS